MVTPVDAAILVAILSLPAFWLVLRHFDWLEDPASAPDLRRI